MHICTYKKSQIYIYIFYFDLFRSLILDVHLQQKRINIIHLKVINKYYQVLIINYQGTLEFIYYYDILKVINYRITLEV